MSRISKGHSPPRPRRGKKTLRRCRNTAEADDVILIDVDADNFDNVIIIDVPESLPKKTQGSSMLGKHKWPFRNVINIDDDETPDSSPFIDTNNVGPSAGTSSNRESSPVAQDFGDSATPVRLSKCKRTYSGKTFKRNRYGLDSDSEIDSSDSDYTDCELMEDPSGKVQEQWEKAFFRRRKDTYNGTLGIRDHDSTSHVINKDNHQNAESKDETRQHEEASFCFAAGKSNNEYDASSPFGTKMDTDHGCTHLSDDDAVDDKQNEKPDAHGQSNSQAKCRPSIHVEQVDCMDCEPGCSGSPIDKRKKNPALSNFGRKKHTASSNIASQEEPAKKFDHAIPIVEDEEVSEVGPYSSESDIFVDEDSCNGKSSRIEGEPTTSKSKSSFEREINRGKSSLGDNQRGVQKANGGVEVRDHRGYRQSNAIGGGKDMGNLIPERCSFGRSTLPEKQADLSTSPSCDAVDVSGKSTFSKVLHSGEGGKENDKETRQLVPETPLFGGIHVNKDKLQDDNYTSDLRPQENKDDELHNQNGDTCVPEETSCLINEREKLKETEEYKRAVEEEWASRQEALQIQAEEARRQRLLRKRRRAESMRLSDMERRQKERIEEMRNSQKKDEENMNLKETIRGEVRDELKKLEIQCRNMASLLHLLGIQVGSWPKPSPQEVQAAYKRALLTFHPDRASQSDIRQQVEAEEKFKLINRLKEKLPPS